MRAVNLIPVEQRGGGSVGAGRSQGGAYAVLALAAGIAVLALLYGIARHDVSSDRQQAAAATSKAQQIEAQAQRLAPYASFITMREQRTHTVETIVDSRFDWAHLFHELGRVLPKAVSLSSLTGTVGSATTAPASATSSSTSATPSGSLPSFTLMGCAVDQGAVALLLERLRLIDGVSEVTLNSSTASTSGGSGGSTSGVGCPSHYPSFTVAVTFDPLPSETAIASATKSVSDTASPGVKAK